MKIYHENYEKCKIINEDNDHFCIIELSFEIIEKFLDIPFEKNEITAVVINGMILRSYNTLQTATLNALMGFGIPALSLLRDSVEIENLLLYFRLDYSEIEKWWYATRKTRLEDYSPGKIRSKISKKIPEFKKILDLDYREHSEMLSHVTPSSIGLQKEFKINSSISQSNNPMFILFCIKDISIHASRIANHAAVLGDVIEPSFKLSKKYKKLIKIKSYAPSHIDEFFTRNIQLQFKRARKINRIKNKNSKL